MKLEYLVITNQSQTFCKDERTFNNLLQADDRIIIDNQNLNFKGSSENITCGYKIETGVVENKNQRFFNIELDYKTQPPVLPKQIEAFNELRRAIRSVLEKMEKEISINLLWNDISLYYAQMTYPLIFEIENLMRKLIQKYFFINVGMDWFDKQIPDDIKSQITSKKGNKQLLHQDALHEADFIHLSKLLLQEHRTLKESAMNEMIKNANTTNELDLSILKNFVLRSNWDRYFKKEIDLDNKQFQVKWEELYEIRIKVAHNKDVTKSDYERALALTEEIKPKLISATESLKQLELPEQEQINAVEYIAEIYSHDDKYTKIDKATLLSELKDCQAYCDKREGFVARKYFIMHWLGNKNYQYDHTNFIINELVKENLIIEYYHNSPNPIEHPHPVRAVMLNNIHIDDPEQNPSAT